MMATSKIPTGAGTPLILDRDLARLIDAELEPLTGKRLEAAHAAMRRVHGSGLTGTRSDIFAAYQKAIRDATKDATKEPARGRAD